MTYAISNKRFRTYFSAISKAFLNTFKTSDNLSKKKEQDNYR